MKTKCCQTSNFITHDSYYLCANHDCKNYLSTTGIQRDYTKAKTYFAVSVFLFSTLFTFDDYSKANLQGHADSTLPYDVNDIPVSVEQIKIELLKHEVICYREVIAQIRLESGNLNSYLLKRTNNLLGMRYPVQRQSTACGIYLPEQDTIIIGKTQELKKLVRQNNYAVYATWQDAIADYALWQQASFKVNERYVEFLGQRYAEDPNYTTKIKSIASSIK